MELINRIISGEIKGVFIDSRKPIKDGLFVPIIGEKFNGNSFVKEAFTKGAKASLVQKQYYEENKEQFNDLDIYLVENTEIALQSLAEKLLLHLNTKVIAITGSNGKTTTKNLMYHVMKTTYKTHATKGNLNNEIGVPLTVLNMPLDTEILILEMGMNHPGEISLLSRIGKPNVAVITNIGTSHIEFLGSIENIRDAKLEILDGMKSDGVLIVNGSDPLLSSYSYQWNHVIKTDANIVTNIKSNRGVYSYTIDEQEIHLSVPGVHNIDNSLLVYEVARVMGITIENFATGISNYSGEKMRMDKHEIKGVLVLNDAYNASTMSMLSSLHTVLEMEATRHIAVLGDVFELGEFSKQEHQKIGNSKDLHKFDAVFTVGEFSSYISEEHPHGRHFSNVNKLNEYLKNFLKPGDLVLVKASRGMELERVVRYLKEAHNA